MRNTKSKQTNVTATVSNGNALRFGAIYAYGDITVRPSRKGLDGNPLPEEQLWKGETVHCIAHQVSLHEECGQDNRANGKAGKPALRGADGRFLARGGDSRVSVWIAPGDLDVDNSAPLRHIGM